MIEKSKIILFIAWVSTILILANEIARSFFKKNIYKENLKEFYEKLSKRDEIIKIKKQEIEKLPENIIKTLFLTSIILLVVFHLRAQHLWNLNYEKKDNDNNVNNKTKKEIISKENYFYLFIIALFVIEIVKTAFQLIKIFFQNNAILKEPLNQEQRIMRLLDKINKYKSINNKSNNK